MGFDVAADAYDRFMGQYSEPLAGEFVSLAGVHHGQRVLDQLADLFDAAGLGDIEQARATVQVEFESFAAWWEPFTRGVGPAGDYVGRLDRSGREELRRACAGLLPSAPFKIDATAWTVTAHAR